VRPGARGLGHQLRPRADIWIIYPAIAWAFLTVASGLDVYLRKPISESRIQREIERQARSSR